MITHWVLNTVGLLATTVAALLIFLHLRSLPSVEALQSPEGRQRYVQYQRRTTLAVGLLAAWLLLQYLAVILL